MTENNVFTYIPSEIENYGYSIIDLIKIYIFNQYDKDIEHGIMNMANKKKNIKSKVDIKIATLLSIEATLLPKVVKYKINLVVKKKNYILEIDEELLSIDVIEPLNMFCLGFLIHCCLGLKRGLYWGINPECFEQLDITILECFASPFNHYSPNYFSLFKGDMLLGAKGNFFDVFATYKFNELTLCTINPPFTEMIISDVIKILHTRLSTNADNIIYLIYLPNWQDLLFTNDDSLAKLFNTEQFHYMQKLLTKTTYNYITKKEIKMVGFSIYLFIIANKSTINLPTYEKYRDKLIKCKSL